MESLWNNLIVYPLMAGLRFFAGLFEGAVAPGIAGGLAIILFTIFIRVVLLPLSLAQVKSQKAMMRIQPDVQELQRKFKGDREGLARAQMALYRERGVNPAAGCLPLVVQMPILFGMYWAMLNLSTFGLSLDQVQQAQVQPQAGRVVYSAQRTEDPLPLNQFVLYTVQVTPNSNQPIQLDVLQESSRVMYQGEDLLHAVQGLTLVPGQSTPNVNWPSTPDGRASVLLRPGGVRLDDGTLDRGVPVQVGQPYIVEVEVYAPRTNVDAATVALQYPAQQATVSTPLTPELRDLPFKSGFLGLRSLGEPDLMHVFGFGLPGVLLLFMTVSSFLTTRMVAMPSQDPQQQMMMKLMAYMPLMYLFFFLQTPSGLVLYWFVSNLFTIFQQFFTTGLGLLGGDIKRLTGKDLQPSWARLTPVHAAAVAPTTRGDGRHQNRNRKERDEADEKDADESTTTRTNSDGGTRPGGTARRTRAPAGRGRKRGKR